MGQGGGGGVRGLGGGGGAVSAPAGRHQGTQQVRAAAGLMFTGKTVGLATVNTGLTSLLYQSHCTPVHWTQYCRVRGRWAV